MSYLKGGRRMTAQPLNDDEAGNETLSVLIRRLITAHPNDSHEKLAHLVAEATPHEDRDAFYTQALVPLVATILKDLWSESKRLHEDED